MVQTQQFSVCFLPLKKLKGTVIYNFIGFHLAHKHRTSTTGCKKRQS